MRPTLIVLALMAIATPALADWQATKWGMTSAEVVSATGNAAKPNTDPDADSDELLAMPYTKAGIKFTTTFAFDEKTKLLNGVRLVPEDGKCAKAFEMAKADYGAPTSTTKGMAGDMDRWQDVGGSTRMMALALPSRTAANYCSITFRPVAPIKK